MSSSSSMCEQQPNDDVCVFMCVSLCNRKNFTICFDYAGDSKPEADGEYLKVFHCVCKVLETQDIKKKGRRKQQQQHTHFVLSFIYIFFHISVFAFFGPIFFSFFGEVVDSTSFPLLPVLKKKIASQNKEEDKNWAQNECWTIVKRHPHL